MGVANLAAHDAVKAREALNRDGFVIVEGLLDRSTVADLKARVDAMLAYEREHPFDPGDGPALPGDEKFCNEYGPFVADAAESERVRRRIRADRAREFDTPWPVPPEEVCISFFHLPTVFDGGRSQRVFNLINKDAAFAPLIEHPAILDIVDAELGRDAVLLDVSINNVGARTDSGGWHLDSPISQMPEPLPDFTLAIQTVWMLDDFHAANGATHVARGSNHTRRQPPKGQAGLDNEVVLEGPAGSLAIWLSQTWHRHGGNSTDRARTGMIVQYGRAWIKPFVDLRTPLTAEFAATLSPRLRYMMGCNANAPVRG
ncbi:MAG: phytanoyl-CoA dioxygenase family protein [Alphaproteobacteria bacterium]